MIRPRYIGLGALTAGTLWGATLLVQALQPADEVPLVDAILTPPPNGAEAWPFVSIIVPARNEARNLPRLLPSLLGQRYPNFELIIVDDQSTDDTPLILAEWMRRDSRLRVVHGGVLPPGWKGKPHAMQQGVDSAKGEWFLFTDADTNHSPMSLSSSISHALLNNIDLFTIGPHFELGGIAEKLIMPVAYEGISVLYPPARVNDPQSPNAIANGQYIMIKKSVYNAAGGVERVKGQIAEDLEFGKAIKSDGYKLRMGDGRRLMSVRMYTNLAEVWEGWSKNVVLSFKGNPLQGFLAVQGVMQISLMPLVMVRWAWLAWRTAKKTRAKEDSAYAAWVSALAFAGAFMPLAYRNRIDRMLGISPLWTLTQPIGGIMFILIMASSVWRLITGKGVTWKGRTYTEG